MTHNHPITILGSDIEQSVANALQYISYYHSLDFIQAMHQAYLKEQNPSAKNAIGQILTNSKLCAVNKRPICQDTGIVAVFLEIGQDVRIQSEESLENIINRAIGCAYTFEENLLRASIVADPIFERKNTQNNTPGIIHSKMVPGKQIKIYVCAKGAGSENKTKFKVLNPSDNLVEWVLQNVEQMGSGWCPPGILGIGVGGTADKAMLMAKESLLEKIDIQEIIERGPKDKFEELRVELYEKINALGIGAQGLGGLTTVLDVKLKTYPTHAASLPVAMIPNCAATRHMHFSLDGSGAYEFKIPDLTLWPDISNNLHQANVKKVNLDTLTQQEIESWKIGDTLLLSGKMLTGRDAAHKRLQSLIQKGEKIPVDTKNKLIYYVGPVDPVNDEVIGPAGPTTATRMDKFTQTIFENTGLLGMIGKAERGDETLELIKKHKKVYLIGVGGAAYLISKSIKKAKKIAFEEMGMEAIYEFEVENLSVTLAVDTQGNSIHKQGPAKWKKIV